MSEAPKTKKGRSARELASGWSILLLAAPFIVFAIGMSLFAVLLSVLFALSGTFPISSSILMIIVYGVCAIVMLGLTFRILRRSSFLAKRIYRIRQEQQRTADLPDRDITRLSLDDEAIGKNIADVAEEQQRHKKSSKLKDES